MLAISPWGEVLVDGKSMGVSPPLSEPAIDSYIQRARTSASLDLYDTLTNREREVLQLVVEGYSSVDIGLRLSLSPKTVDTYRGRLMRKLGVPNLPGLIRFAIDNALTPAWLPAKPPE